MANNTVIALKGEANLQDFAPSSAICQMSRSKITLPQIPLRPLPEGIYSDLVAAFKLPFFQVFYLSQMRQAYPLIKHAV